MWNNHGIGIGVGVGVGDHDGSYSHPQHGHGHDEAEEEEELRRLEQQVACAWADEELGRMGMMTEDIEIVGGGSVAPSPLQDGGRATDEDHPLPPDCSLHPQKKGRASEKEKGSGSSRKRTRRHRSAQAHNFTERKRRDRINERMRTLQRLVPRPSCSKSDKASLLDEAISYLQSLQMQLQIMTVHTYGCYGMRPAAAAAAYAGGGIPLPGVPFASMDTNMLYMFPGPCSTYYQYPMHMHTMPPNYSLTAPTPTPTPRTQLAPTCSTINVGDVSTSEHTMSYAPTVSAAKQCSGCSCRINVARHVSTEEANLTGASTHK